MTRAALVIGVVMLLVAGCGGGDDGQPDADERTEAIRALELTSKTTRLHDEMTQLVDRLGDAPSAGERKEIGKRLDKIDREAEELLGGAGSDRHFEVELEPINESDVKGTLRLARRDRVVTAEGGFTGARANRRQLLSVNALEEGEGGSVCPPPDAETGRDDELSASEAADFFGEEALDLGNAESATDGAVEVDARADSAPGDLPPLDARAVVIYDDDELPVACGVPSTIVPQQEDPDPADMASAAAGQTHAAVLYLIVVADDPTAPTARYALDRGRVRLTDARSRLQRTVERIEAILDDSGDDLDPRERELLETARSRLRDAGDLGSGLDAVEEFIAAEERKQRRRERERRERRRQERQQQQQQPRSGAPEPAQPAPDAEDSDGPDADDRDDAPENRQPDEGDGDRTPPRRGGGGTETCPDLPPGGCSNIPQPPDCRCVVDEN